MNTAIKPLLLALLLSGCATADVAQFADSGSTAAAFHYGFVEANPVLSGLPLGGIVAAKFAMTQAIKLTPQEVCEPGLFFFTLSGSAGALWNVALIAGAGPASLPVIAAIWAWQWDRWQEDAKTDCQTSHRFLTQGIMP